MDYIIKKEKEEIEIESWEKDKPMWRAARRERGSCKVPANGEDCATSLSDAQVQHCVADALATPCIARDPAIYGGEIAKQHRSHRPQGNHVLSTVMLDDDENIKTIILT